MCGNIYKFEEEAILYRTEDTGSGSTLKRPLSRTGNLFQKQKLVAFHLTIYIILFPSLSFLTASLLSQSFLFAISLFSLLFLLFFSPYYPSDLSF